MAHIRFQKHYFHTPFLVTAFLEAMAIFGAAYAAHWTLSNEAPGFYEHLPFALTFALTNLFLMASFGVYEAQLREGFSGVMLRTGVAVFLLGTLAMAVIFFFTPSMSESREVLLIASIEAYAFIALIRWVSINLIDESFMKSRVVILGTGTRAVKIASRMRRRSDRRAFVLVGFIQMAPEEDCVSEYGANVLPYPEQSLIEFCREQQIDEIVVASDDRRSATAKIPLPYDELMESRLSGVAVCEVQNFIEREAGKLDIDLLQRSWIVFSDGFTPSTYSAIVKRSFDVLAAIILGLILSPLWLLAAVLVFASSPVRGSVLYRQIRTGLDGEQFTLFKFRTMGVDAEASGAVWADRNDARVTRIGRVLRKTRLDELPQLYNVIKGEMSIVGPRPERPVFVDYLNEQLPFYNQRHRIKPGLTGWAQLCYPYGASVDDAKEKLQYDLYYLKNQSLLLDLIILFQTLEVVLLGDGAR